MDKTKEAGTQSRNDELYPLVAKGDRAAMDEMILVNMALVKHKVDSFLAMSPQHGYLQADLISQGTVGLVQAVNLMAGIKIGVEGPVPKLDNKNPTGFISVSIYYRLGELIDAENAIRVPSRSRRRKGFMVPVKQDSVEAIYTLDKDGQNDPRACVDLIDELEGCCESDEELQIIRQRVRGSDDPEIAEMLGIPRSTVNLMRRQIEQRFLERNDEYTD